MRKLVKALFLAGVLLFGLATLGGPSLGQAPRDYEDFQVTREYMEAYQRLSRSYPEAVSMWLELADRNPGTTLGAKSLGAAAYNAPPQQAVTIYQRAIAEYPQSRFEVTAKQALINLQFGFDHPQERLDATDRLIQSYGGPGLQEILQANDRRPLTRRVHDLRREIQLGLVALYGELHGSVSGQFRRFDDGLKLARFSQETFYTLGPKAGPNFASTDILHDLMQKTYGKLVPYNGTRVDPQVKFLMPKPQRNKGPRPRIKVEITVGDFNAVQVDLSKVQLTLDGQDITAQTLLRSKMQRKLKPGKPLERLRLTYRPTQPLARGQHTVGLVVPTLSYPGTGPGIARVDWTFSVSRDRDDEEDEREDDADDRDEWDD